MIAKCNCHSPYQDKKYGKGKRVFNRVSGTKKEGQKKGVARCSVCSTILTDTIHVWTVVKPDVV